MIWNFNEATYKFSEKKVILTSPNCLNSTNFKNLNVSRSHSKHFEVSVLQSKKSKCLGLAKKNACLAVSQSVAITIRHPCMRRLPKEELCLWFVFLHRIEIWIFV